jgi:NAD(P)-dependent dehydrogenase (short-subunit alcohol dehydrogenase family)
MTSTSELSDTTTMVVGASRGLRRGIATAFAEAGARVISVARTTAPVTNLAGGDRIQHEVADAGDARVAASLLDRYKGVLGSIPSLATTLLPAAQRRCARLDDGVGTSEMATRTWSSRTLLVGSDASGAARPPSA